MKPCLLCGLEVDCACCSDSLIESCCREENPMPIIQRIGIKIKGSRTLSNKEAMFLWEEYCKAIEK